MSQKQALINATELIIDHYHLIPVVQLLNEINQAKNWIFDDQDFNLIYRFLKQQVKKSIPVANDVVAIYQDQDQTKIIVILHIANHYHKVIFTTDLNIKQLKVSFQNQWLTNLKTLLTKWKVNQSYRIRIDLELNQMIVYDREQIYWTNHLMSTLNEKLLIADEQNYYFNPDWLKLNHINFSTPTKIKFSKSIWHSQASLHYYLIQHCFWNWKTLSWEFDAKLSNILKTNVTFPPILKPIANFESMWLMLVDQIQKTILTICQNLNFKISDINLQLNQVEFNHHWISFNRLSALEQWSQDWFLLGQNSQNSGFRHRQHDIEIHFDHSVDLRQYWDDLLLDFIDDLLKIDKTLKIKMIISKIALSDFRITYLDLACQQITFIYEANQDATDLQLLISFIKDLLQPIRKLNLNQLTTIKLTYQDHTYQFATNCDDTFKINFSNQSDLTSVVTKWKNVLTINAFAFLAAGLRFNFNDKEYCFFDDHRKLSWINYDQISNFDYHIIKSYLKWWTTNERSNLDEIIFVNLIKPKRQVKWKQFNYVLTNHCDFPFQALIAQGIDWKHLNTFYANLYYAPSDVVLDRIDKLIKAKLLNSD